MKAMFISDLHFHNYKPFSTVIGGYNSRLIDIEKSVDVAFKIADTEGCEMVIVAGDIFHTRGNLKPSVIATAKGVFSKRDQKIIMIAGNHDMEDYRGGDTALEVFKGMDNILIVERPTRCPFGTGNILCMPYIHDIEEFKDEYEKRRPNAETVFAAIHQGIDDFGDMMGLPGTSLTSEFLLKGHDAFVFAGHYHNSFIKNDRAVQVGAICQHNFGDVGQERGCWIFDSSEKTAEFKPIDIAPKFIDIEKWDKASAKEAKGNFVRVTGKTESAIKKISAKLADLDTEFVVRLEKEFKTAHEKAIAMDRPINMLSAYIDIQENLMPIKTEILALYREISDEAV